MALLSMVATISRTGKLISQSMEIIDPSRRFHIGVRPKPSL
jgi:hypothetical protein